MAANERIVLITGDLGFGVLRPVWERFPKQILNAGIAQVVIRQDADTHFTIATADWIEQDDSLADELSSGY
jgi:hypothetical protein